MTSRPYPAVTPRNQFFWTAGAVGVLRLQQCSQCAQYIHPPKPRCPECLSDAIKIVDLSGRATVATYTINAHQWHPDFPPPYVIAIVEIEEAPYVRLTTRIVDCEPGEIAIGTRVRVVFEEQGPAWMPLFKPEEA
jgi:uncharacterized OB-fold protein